MGLQEQLVTWDNLRLAYQSAARGKRGQPAAAGFELYLADNLLELEAELRQKTYQPGAYHSFYIHEPKKRLISTAPRVLARMELSLRAAAFWRRGSPLAIEGIASASKKRWLRNDKPENGLDVHRLC